MPMQPLVDTPRSTLTGVQVVALLQDAPAITLTGGLELVDLSLAVLQDISDDLAGGHVERNSYATLHASAQFAVTRQLDWGAALVRPYIVVSDGTVSARFNLGVYHTSTPTHDLEEVPPTYDVAGYDLLLRLAQPVGDAYAIAAGDAYLAKVEDILVERGYTQYVIDQSAAATVAPTSRVWVFDAQTTWLGIVNDLLASIGYAGIWADWDGRLHCDRYQVPLDRAPEWFYPDDPDLTMLSTKRSIERDYFAAPNRWVIYRSNQVEGDAPVEGDGIYTYVNEAVGDTSVAARGGLVVTRVEAVDVADHAALLNRAAQIIDADMQVPTVIPVETSPNPLHWHFDRLLLSDQQAGTVTDVMCTQWRLPLPPSTGDMSQTWRVLAQ